MKWKSRTKEVSTAWKLVAFFAILSTVTVFLNAWQTNTDSFMGDIPLYNVSYNADQMRGIYTDNIVCAVYTALLGVTVYVTGYRVDQLEMVFYCMQEISNYMCDNALASTRLTRARYDDETRVLTEAEFRANFKSTEFDGRRITADDVMDSLGTRNPIIPLNNEKSCSNFGGRKREMYRHVFLRMKSGKDHKGEILFEKTITSNDGNVRLVEVVVDYPIEELPLNAYVETFQPLRVIQTTMLEFGNPRVVRSMVVSLATVFMLSSFNKTMQPIIDKTRSRFAEVLMFWVTSSLASIPVNTLRFGWAYVDHGVTKVSTGIVALVYLLVYATYLNGHALRDEITFSRRSKLIIGVLGLAAFGVYVNVPIPSLPCEIYDLFEIFDSPAPFNARILFLISQAIGTLLYFTCFYFIMHSQISRL